MYLVSSVCQQTFCNLLLINESKLSTYVVSLRNLPPRKILFKLQSFRDNLGIKTTKIANTSNLPAIIPAIKQTLTAGSKSL